MSFILDALKKSENDRQEHSAAEFASVPSGSASSGPPRWLWALVALLAINVVVLLGLLLRDDTRAVIADAVDVPTAAQPQSNFADRIEEARERQPVTVARAEPDPEPQLQQQPVQATEAPPVSEPGFTLAAMPTAAELRANGTLQMAELHLDIHVYSETPEDRFVFINMVRHKESSRLAEGPVVREITPEGVILDFLGTEFLLPRE
jgi:general secretion pathway protein B